MKTEYDEILKVRIEQLNCGEYRFFEFDGGAYMYQGTIRAVSEKQALKFYKDRHMIDCHPATKIKIIVE